MNRAQELIKMCEQEEQLLLSADSIRPGVDKYKVGDSFRVAAATPGYGYFYYRITRIDSEGIWGIPTRNDVGIFSPQDVV
jgi:hypothetical protein